MENHGHQVALYFFHYNFCRIHKTLRVTPAVEAGIPTTFGRWKNWWDCCQRKSRMRRPTRNWSWKHSQNRHRGFMAKANQIEIPYLDPSVQHVGISRLRA